MKYKTKICDFTMQLYPDIIFVNDTLRPLNSYRSTVRYRISTKKYVVKMFKNVSLKI